MNAHPSGLAPMIVHTDENGVRTIILDNLGPEDVADAEGLASETEWQLRQKDGDYLGEYDRGGRLVWSLNTDPESGERWLKVTFDPR